MSFGGCNKSTDGLSDGRTESAKADRTPRDETKDIQNHSGAVTLSEVKNSEVSAAKPSGGDAGSSSAAKATVGVSEDAVTKVLQETAGSPTQSADSTKPKQFVLPEAFEHYKKAMELGEKGKTADAKDEFTEALRIQPDFTAARNSFGTFLLSQNDLITASIVYKEGAKLHPDDPDAHNDLGVVLIRTGDVPGARKEFQRAIELNDDDPEPHHNLGLLLATLGELDAAIEQYNKAIRLRPGYLDAHFDLGRALLRKERLDAAIAQFREVLRLSRGHFGALYNLGLALTKQGKAGEAIKEYAQALRANPNDAELRVALGAALAQLGNDKEAVPNFIEAVRLRPENADAHYELALSLSRLGRIDEAIAHNEEALGLRPDWPEALNNLAWILATSHDDRLRNQKRAVELANRARELADFKMPLVLDTQAAALADAGKFPEAVKIAEKAVALARDTGQEKTAKEIEARLDLYRAGKAYREPAPPKDATNGE
ncbi:MAG TPA: tetratricopeptide repeat protein [Pirellulales bacterium]|nr:tetratricopeptide repeat protein [Pirellulales bacterium]